MQNAEIKAEVESWLLDLPNGATQRVQGWVNEAIREACKRYNFRQMEATASYETVEHARELGAKPADWKENRELPYYIRQDGSTREIEWAPSESDMVRTYAIDPPQEGNQAPIDEGAPRWLYERPDTIDVYPFPDAKADWDDGNYRIIVPYWRYPEALAEDEDENFLTIEAPFYVIFKAVEMGFKWNRDTTNAAQFAVEAEMQFKRLERADKLSKFPDRINLAVHTGAYHRRSRSGLRG